MSVAATFDWLRSFTPGEGAAVRAAIATPRLQMFFTALLHSGVMYAEMHQLRDDPDRFDGERGVRPPTRRWKQRTVVQWDKIIDYF